MAIGNTRREAILAGLAAALGPETSLAQIARMCPTDPTISNRVSPLTIDVHAHFFNGSDLQIKEFLSATVVGPESELRPLVRGVGSLIQTLGWNLAPSARQEGRAISRYADVLKTCEGAEQMRRAAAPLYEEGYALGRRELQSAAESLYQAPATAEVLGPRTGRAGIGVAIKDLPESFEEYERRRTDAASVLGSQPTVLGYIQFILHNFNHRHVNAIDYLTTYSKGSLRKIDLVTPSLVDYDWWLAQGRATPTSLSEQVDVMRDVSVLLGGRVHGFAPFCPFREAMTKGGDGIGDSLRLVRRAIETEGFVGVKLYPPMGFAAWGNEGLEVWKGKPGLLSAASEPTFGKGLDAAMESLFQYCIANDVPVMAHTNHSNGPNDEFMNLAGSEYWQRALQKFKGLRVSFGHFGDTDLEDDGTRTRNFLKLFTPGVGTSGGNAFADSGFFAGVLLNQGKMRDALTSLYAGSQDRVLLERLMYGTDWTMILPQKNVERYLSAFMDVMGKVEGVMPGVSARQTTISNAFFGANAVEFLGLRKGRANRGRLEAFYAKHKVPDPDWIVKVG